jgi:MFS family permease
VDGPGWEWIFYINIPIGLAALALTPFLLRESHAETTRRSFDPAGALTVTGALVLIVYAVVEAPEAGWSGTQTIGLLAASALLLVLFAAIEARAVAPLVPLRFLASRRVVGANLAMLITGTLAWGIGVTLTQYAQQVLGYSALEFGVSSVVIPVGAVIGTMSGQAIVLRIGFKPVAATALALTGCGALILTQVSAGGTYVDDIFFGLLLFGPGLGAAFVTASIAALAGVAEREAGLASGLNNTAWMIGGALGTAIVSSVALSRTNDYTSANPQDERALALTAGFQSAFWACVALAGVGVVVALVLLGRPRIQQEKSQLAPTPVGADDRPRLKLVVCVMVGQTSELLSRRRRSVAVATRSALSSPRANQRLRLATRGAVALRFRSRVGASPSYRARPLRADSTDQRRRLALPKPAIEAWQEAGPRRVRRELSARLRDLGDRGLLRVDDSDRAAIHLLRLIGPPTPPYLAVTPSDKEIEQIVTAGVRAFLYGYLA